ncbi:MAG: adenosine deaminase [Bdellovibrio sp.]|nr:MAG: adenosine deaminase [Bdellovibrio sp.]
MKTSDIKFLPKVELHRHLELSLRAETIKELAPSHGIEVPDEKTFKERFLILEPMKDLASVLNKFLDTQKLLSSKEILERITYEACEDAFNENIKILELRYSPTFIQQGHEHLSFQDIHEAIVAGKKKAEENFPMCIGIICIIQRILPVKDAQKVTEFAIDNKETFIGLDLADNEVGFDSKPFAPFFQKAKEAGLGITVHSGEANVPKAPRYVMDAIEYLGATRIGHGIQIYKNPEVMAFVAENNIVLELCPTSNWLTQAIPDLKDYPIRRLIDAGVKVTINTDDPGIFNTNLNKEYEILVNYHQFTREELIQLAKNAGHASFLPPQVKNKYLDLIF